MPDTSPLVIIGDWPADPADITPEHVRLLCNGDVAAVLRDMAQLALASAPAPAPPAEVA